MRKFLKKLFATAFGSARPVSSARSGAAAWPADSELRQSEEHFGQLVAGVRDYAVILLDPSGRVRTWNAGAESITGHRAEEMIGQHYSRFHPHEAVTTDRPAHELDVAATTGRFEDEGWRVRKDGTRFWANVVITALRDDQGSVRGYVEITRDLTERRQAEQELRASEERFRLLIEGASDHAIFMLDPEGRVSTWNAGALHLKGYTADEIIGRHFSCFYLQEAIARKWPEEELRRATEIGRFEDEGWRVRKDGTQFWANVVITALRGEGGELRGFAKVTRDLSERRRAEESARRLLAEEAARKAAEAAAQEIERQREQLHVTLESIGDAVIVTDADGAVTFLNPVAVELTGWQPQDATGQDLGTVFRIINEKSGLPVENPVAKVFRERRVVALANHTALVAKDGRAVPIEDTAAPIQIGDGSISGAVLVFRDVTKERRALEARLRLAAIVESSDDAIIGNDLGGRITSWNKGAARLYGYTEEEILGEPLALLVPPENRDELTALMAGIERGEEFEHYETERVRKDGSRVVVSLTISPIRDGDGQVVGASKIARDITARRDEERRKDEFLALLAHELRNPLAPLRNGLHVMRLATRDPAALEQVQMTMERQLQHLVRLVDDLLDVSRISRGKLQLRRERISLAAVVEHALDVCRPDELGHELTVALPAEELFVDADKTRLAQALCNLLSNAAKYSPAGSPISLRVSRTGDEAVISVEDRGVGIPEEMLPRVFDLFTQIDRTLERSQGGLGVGLTIVKRLVEMHDGTVEAHSGGQDAGSEFIVRLPIVAAPVEIGPDDVDAGPLPASDRRRVLVVDDNIDAAQSLRMMLELMGNDVRSAHDGLQALEVAAEFEPDLVLLDIGMPELNGYETCRRLREQEGTKRAVVVALTGWGQAEDHRRSAAAGFDRHIVKPADPATLEKLLSELEPESA